MLFRSDFMQLFKKNVRIFDPIKNKILNLDDVKNKFGVEPNMIIDVQALVGDPSDNVPGVPGIGVKTAAELINHYKTLENLLNKVEEIKQNKKRESIILNKEKAILSKKLVTLKHDVSVKNTLESFRLKNINKEKLYSFLREMEFNRLLSNVIKLFVTCEPKKGTFGPNNISATTETANNKTPTSRNLFKYLESIEIQAFIISPFATPNLTNVNP